MKKNKNSNLDITQSQKKCNLSSTEAWIFMKFETYAHKLVVYHKPNFHKDPRKDARARSVNARTRDEMRACAFTPRTRASLQGSL